MEQSGVANRLIIVALILDVLFEALEGSTASRNKPVAPFPKDRFPVVGLQKVSKLFPNFPAGDCLEDVYKFRQGNVRSHLNQQVNVVITA